MKQNNRRLQVVAQRYCKVKTPVAEPEYIGLRSGIEGGGKWE